MRLIKPVVALLMLACCIFTGVAQSDNDNENEFAPIHQTLVPGDRRFHFEDNYDTNSSVYLIGDELLLKSKKFNSAIGTTVLPLNPNAEYSIEVTIFTKKFSKMGAIGVVANGYGITFSKKKVLVVVGNKKVYEPKKWKFPEGNVKDEIKIKFVRRRDIVTIFVNNEYVTEISAPYVKHESEIAFTLIDLKSSEIQIKSIKLDQGSDEAED